jgi:hypothetical protein
LQLASEHITKQQRWGTTMVPSSLNIHLRISVNRSRKFSVSVSKTIEFNGTSEAAPLTYVRQICYLLRHTVSIPSIYNVNVCWKLYYCKLLLFWNEKREASAWIDRFIPTLFSIECKANLIRATNWDEGYRVCGLLQGISYTALLSLPQHSLAIILRTRKSRSQVWNTDVIIILNVWYNSY